MRPRPHRRQAVRQEPAASTAEQSRLAERSCVSGLVDSGKLEEILEKSVTMLRGNAIGVELQSVNRLRPMSNAHDDAIVRFRSDDKVGRQARPLDHERMIPRGEEAIGKASKDALAAVMNARKLAMHGNGRSHDLAAIGLA